MLPSINSPRLHFCFALHADDGPATLLWLQHNVFWNSRGLRWITSHPLRNSAPTQEATSAPESESQESPAHPSPVYLITASACSAPELVAAVDATIVKVWCKVVESTCSRDQPLLFLLHSLNHGFDEKSVLCRCWASGFRFRLNAT